MQLGCLQSCKISHGLLCILLSEFPLSCSYISLVGQLKLWFKTVIQAVRLTVPLNSLRVILVLDTPKPSFRVYAVIFWLLVFGIAMFAHGWFGWTEGSVLVRLKNAPPYIAAPGSSTATSFYIYTLGFMAVGCLAILGVVYISWSVLFSSPSNKINVIRALSQPMKGRQRPAIPLWFFWGVIFAFVSVFIYAAIKYT